MSQDTSNKKKIKIGRLLLILVGGAIIICFGTIDGFMRPITDSFKSIAESKSLFYIIVAISTFLGILHLNFVSQKGLAKEHLLFRRMGPIISSPLTAATQGVFIYSGIEIVYIVCYDVTTMKQFHYMNKLAISVTMLVIVIYALYILGAMTGDILTQDLSSKPGKIIRGTLDENDESED